MYASRRQAKGHNLLEMVVATMIFCTTMIAFAAVYQYIATATAKSRTRIVAQYLAKGLIERCVAARFINVPELASTGSLAQTPPAVYPPVTLTFRKNGQAIDHVFEQEVQVDDSVAEYPPGVPIFVGNTRARLVTVRVTWEEKNRRGAGNSARPFVEYRTYIGENS